jgi:hypothetical protein
MTSKVKAFENKNLWNYNKIKVKDENKTLNAYLMNIDLMRIEQRKIK